MIFDTATATRRLEEKVKQARAYDHIPSQLVDFLQKVHAAQIAAQGEAVLVLPPDEDLASPDMRIQGAALWNRENFPYDAAQAQSLFTLLVALTTELGGPMGEAAALVTKALDAGELDVEDAFGHLLHQDEEFFAQWAAKTPSAPHMMQFLTQASLAPSVAAAAESLARNLDPAAVWPHGHCPVCGSLPLVSELHAKEGQRFQICSFCQTSYRAKRIGCAFCGETDAKKLSFFTANGEKGFRVDACQTCKMYLKTSDFRALDRTYMALWDDLLSISLDILAEKEGFKRPTPSGWGF
ncbi:MAG: formate dehydrogenase accessory protein FdhE [Desulfovibrionaceae bacterium]